jgi:hypothetical protein
MCPHNTVRVSFYYCILLEFSGVSASTNESEISRSEKIHLEKLIKKAEKADMKGESVLAAQVCQMSCNCVLENIVSPFIIMYFNMTKCCQKKDYINFGQ